MRKLWLVIPLVLTAVVWLYGCDEQLPSAPSVPEAAAQTPAAPAMSVITANASQILYACYQPGSGGTYRIKTEGAPDACRNVRDVEFSWNAEGPPGSPGPKGDPGPSGAVEVRTVSRTVALGPLWGGEQLLSCPGGYTSISGGWLLVSPGSSEWADLYEAGSFKVTDSWKWKFKNWSTAMTFRVLLEVYCVPKAT
jgi:hypothetical protein